MFDPQQIPNIRIYCYFNEQQLALLSRFTDELFICGI